MNSSIGNDLLISVVVPIKNQEFLLKPFIVDLEIHLTKICSYYEVILVDYGDYKKESLTAVKNLLNEHHYCRYLRLSKSSDVEIATMCGMENSIGDFCVVMMINEDPPHILPQALRLAVEGQGIVSGVDKNALSFKNQSTLSKLLSFGFQYYCRKYLGFDLPSYSTRFRILNRKAVNELAQLKTRYPMIVMYGSTISWNSVQFPYVQGDSGSSQEPKSLMARVQYGLDIVFSSSTVPLLQVTFLNCFFIFISVLIFIISKINNSSLLDFIATTALLCTGLLFSITIYLLSKYIGQILVLLQRGSRYIIIDEMISNVMINNKKNLEYEKI